MGNVNVRNKINMGFIFATMTAFDLPSVLYDEGKKFVHWITENGSKNANFIDQ